ncbi:MAG TPA: FxLYD domain-containing protein [Candidatus Sulfopaludibacter sp.]|nr:FxLYD domain-containing protein [Candidatus Sulfopaludibacter sp.]
MAANKTAQPEAKSTGISIPPAAVAVGLVLLLGVAGFLYLNYKAKQPPPELPPLTGDARDYVRAGHLPISEVQMSAHESYLKQQVVEITGKIGNTGNRVIDTAEIYCVFYDGYGQVILRERLPIVSRKMGRLAPGEVKDFRLPFDSIPESWNQALPQIVIARIEFD